MHIFYESIDTLTRIRLVYCDMDGVLADFHAGMRQAFPLDIKTDADLETFLSPPDGWTTTNARAPHLFYQLPVLPGAHRLMSELVRLRRRDQIELKILTAIPSEIRMSAAADDKRRWMNKHFPEIPSRDVHVVKRSQKQEFAKGFAGQPPAILIDDFEKNIREWRTAGGIGLLYTPASVESVLQELSELLSPS